MCLGWHIGHYAYLMDKLKKTPEGAGTVLDNSVVVFMVWVYYAALILLFGAEITQAVADQRGAVVLPSEHANPTQA